MIEELFPKALNEIESSINKLKKCYFSFYKRKNKQERHQNSLSSEINHPHPKKQLEHMDIETLQKLYQQFYHKKTNDILELYNFYKEYTSENKPKTFRNPQNQAFSSQNYGRLTNSAIKKKCVFNELQDISSKEKESKEKESEREANILSKHLKKICQNNEYNQKNKLFISAPNQNLPCQKLNFANMAPTTKNSKPPRPESFRGNSYRNAKSTEKIAKKDKINNNSFGFMENSNTSLEKKNILAEKKPQNEILKIISPNNRKNNNIFSGLSMETQQKIILNQVKITDIEKIRNISKIFKNYRSIKSEIPAKIIAEQKRLCNKENKCLNFIESFLEKSDFDAKTMKNTELMNKNEEEIDERSFFEGLKQAASYNDFQGKDLSNAPSFLIQN